MFKLSISFNILFLRRYSFICYSLRFSFKS